MTILTIEPELHAKIRPPNRQLLRRAKRGEVRCCRCGEKVAPDEIVFDQDRSGHRRCAEHINDVVDQLNLEAARDRLVEAGMELPAFELLLPPGA